jgi:hypothetical protein
MSNPASARRAGPAALVFPATAGANTAAPGILACARAAPAGAAVVAQLQQRSLADCLADRRCGGRRICAARRTRRGDRAMRVGMSWEPMRHMQRGHDDRAAGDREGAEADYRCARGRRQRRAGAVTEQPREQIQPRRPRQRGRASPQLASQRLPCAVE